MKKILMTLFIFAMFFTIAACDQQDGQGEKYVITIETNGGNNLANVMVDVNSTKAELPTPIKEGYTFVGWYINEELTENWDGTVTGNLTVYAKWIINSYTLSYETNSSDPIDEIVYEYGAELPEQPKPVKKGYIFKGWYLDQEFKDVFDLDTMPAKDLTLYAKWEAEVYKVMFLVDNIQYKTLDVKYGSTIERPLDPVKPGFTFVEWQVAGETFDFNTIVSESLDIEAKFVINQYKVYYNIDGEIVEQSYNYLAEITPIERPTKEGYEFVAWTYRDSETGIEKTFTFEDSKMPARDLYLKATWEVNKHSIEFLVNGGTPIAKINDIEFNSRNFLPADPTKDGYVFAGWYLDNDFNEKFTLKTMPDRDLVLFAKWTPIDYSIRFNANGGTGTMKNQALSFDEKLALSKNTFKKEGYTFVGWATTANGEKVYADMQEVYNLTNTPNTIVELYAVWQINSYTLIFDTNGGILSGETELLLEYGAMIIVPKDPTREGYTFDGWNIKIPETMPAKNVIVEALWKINSYTITFDTDGGSTINAITANYGTVINLSNEPSKLGYTFAGWSTEIPSTMPANNLTIKALWTINQYTITFDTDGGSAIEAITADYNSEINKPSNPTKKGYTFAGWDKAVPANMPAENLTIKATWNPIVYYIEFNANNGSGIMDKMTVSYEDIVSLNTNKFNREGYTFLGWSFTQDEYQEGYVCAFDDQDTISKLTDENGKTFTLYAVWKINSYLFTVNYNNGQPVKSYYIVYGEKPELETEPTLAGYAFDYWSWNNNPFDFATFTMPASDVTVVAIYENIYTITFDTDGGSYIDAISGIAGATVTAPANPTKTGYTFAGWDTTIPANMPANNITIKALWTINQYTITFDTDGGSAIEAITQDYNSEINRPLNPTKAGYTFAGWDSIIPANMPANNVTIKATWTINQYTITFDTDGGSAIEAITADYNTVINKPANPTKTGYTFAGWDTTIPANMPANNLTIKATWTINQYTITFDTNGGNAIEAITQDYNTKVTAPANPTKTGYTFAGWYKDRELSAKYTFSTIAAENITLYANWTPITYTVSFKQNGGTGNMNAQTFTYGVEQELSQNVFTKLGYTFVGWAETADGEVKYTQGQKVSNLATEATTINLYAVWKANTYNVVFDGKGATSGSMNAQTFTYDTEATLTSNGYHKLGYSFAGWDTDSSATTVVYGNGVNVSNLSSYDNSTVTLYAVWTINQYTISFSTGKGTEVADITADYNSLITEPTKPTLTGYTFAGWYTDAEYNNKYTFSTMPANNMVLYAKWDINYYTVTINFPETHQIAAKPLTLSIAYNTNLSDYLSANSISISRLGYTVDILKDSVSCLDSFSTYRVTEDVTFDVVYTVKTYTVNFIMDGYVFYTLSLPYGTQISFDDIIDEIHSTATALHTLITLLNNAVNGVNIGAEITQSSTASNNLRVFHGTYGNVILGLNHIDLVKLYTKLIQGQAASSEVEILLQYVNNVYLAYEQAGQAYPKKENHIFTGWVLGAETYYLSSVPGDAYQGYVPAGTTDTSHIVANFVKASSLELEPSDYNEESKELTWTNEWNEFVAKYVIAYYGKDAIYEYSFDIANYNFRKDLIYVLTTTTNTTYQFMTNNTFSLPGYYEIVVIANVAVKDSAGNVIAQFSSLVGDTIPVTLSPKIEDANLSSSGEYFYIFEDEKIMYFFTNTSYSFDSYVEVTEVVNDNNSASDHVSVSYENDNTVSVLTTTNTPGDFLLRVYSNESEFTEYYVFVYPTVTDFSFIQSLTDFKFNVNNASTTEFLNDSSSDTYKIGNKVTGLNITDYANNGVKLDTIVLTNGGLEIDVEQYSEYLKYTFYKFTSKWEQIIGTELENFAVYNETSKAWEINGEDGVKYKVVVEIADYCLPQALETVIKPIELEFETNNCLNVYSHEKLQSVYANLNYKNGINIHSDIVPYLTDMERYTQAAIDNNPAIALLQTITYNDHKMIKNKKELDYTAYSRGHMPYAEYWATSDNILFDGSPINLTPWEAHHMLAKAYLNYKDEIDAGNLTNYFNYLATLRTGDIYYRGGIVPADYTENYQINGNYFEIDGSKLPYMTCNSISNLSNVSGYYVVHCYSSIFSYQISINTPENTNMTSYYELGYAERYIKNDAVLNINDLLITSNTSTTHQAGDELTNSAIALMNRNSGGYCGITANFGGKINVENSVVRGATLAIAARFESELTINQTYLLSTWANSVYCHDAGDVVITNSYIKNSGGSAIYVEDTESNVKNTKDANGNYTLSNNTVTLDINTRIDNYISGAEGYFNAYGMTSNVVFLKGQLEPQLNASGLKSVMKVTNYLGLETEMLNFVYMACPAGANAGENVDGTEICNISLIIVDATGNTIKHNSHDNVAGGANFMSMAYLNPATNNLNLGYCILSYAIPTKGNAVLGLAIDLK